MRDARFAVLAALAGTTGCAAAIVPAVAGGAIARHKLKHHAAVPAPTPAPASLVTAAGTPQAAGRVPAPAPTTNLPQMPSDPAAMKPGQVYVGTAPPLGGPPPAAPAPDPAAEQEPVPRVILAPPPSAAIPAAMQYLYGSGEAAALSMQVWRALTAYVAAKLLARPADSVVLARGATLDAPRFEPCGTKPLAAVFEIDETVLLNLGFEADAATHPGRPYSEARWRAWERSGAGRTIASAGAVSSLSALRTMGVAVLFNSNRSAANAAGTEATLARAGLGPAKHGDTLFLQGDDATGAAKDGRRAAIAARYCVVAMAGNQLGDFSDQFDASGATPRGRRLAAEGAAIGRLWGAGWFVLPNPVYGTALKGGVDDVFPPAKRWSPAP